jgi:hypothetical protein
VRAATQRRACLKRPLAQDTLELRVSDDGVAAAYAALRIETLQLADDK